MRHISLTFIAFFVLARALTLATPNPLPHIVSTAWLSQNLNDPRLAILDIRNADQYGKGHIPGSISTPLKQWITAAGDLTFELPPEDSIAQLLGKSGIADEDSKWIVIVNRTESDFSRADTTRVAWTCLTAGIKHIAVLDGGFNKWIKENKPVSIDATIVAQQAYRGSPNRTFLASKNYVLARIGKAALLDARTSEDYFGITSKPGHIKGAVNLPTPWVFLPDGTFRAEDDLRAMVSGVLGNNKSREVIVYCGVGGYASTWWFLLHQVFGYKNVKVYDGSMEEWVKDKNTPVTTYSWQ